MPPIQLDPFYPIVPDFEWLKRLVPLGIRTIQLRLKDATAREIESQIAMSIEFCVRHDCQLIVNDYWREAIQLGGNFIHLGQEDLATADLEAIRAAGMKFGLSSHDHEELATAMAAAPAYIALGPIYETTLKVMKWAPQGLKRLSEWKAAAGCPVVAIGGITLERAESVRLAGADSIAVVTDIIANADPQARTRQWLKWSNSLHAIE